MIEDPSQPKIKTFAKGSSFNKELKSTELRITGFVVCHTSFRCVFRMVGLETPMFILNMLCKIAKKIIEFFSILKRSRVCGNFETFSILNILNFFLLFGHDIKNNNNWKLDNSTFVLFITFLLP